MILTIAASIWYCLSWNTRSSVAFCSSLVSFSWILRKKIVKGEIIFEYQDHLVDLNLEQRILEGFVVDKLVSVIDISAFRRLDQNTCLATRQGLEIKLLNSRFYCPEEPEAFFSVHHPQY